MGTVGNHKGILSFLASRFFSTGEIQGAALVPAAPGGGKQKNRALGPALENPDGGG
jgi:hypothetical protein